MSKSLIIVESPSKAKTINKYLGKEYHVIASVGHIKNLPKSKFGVDVDNGYAVSYETIAGKEEIIESLKEHAKKAEAIFLATDPDREGEMIAANIAEEVQDSKKPIKRVLFHEITETGIREGMSHPRALDKHLIMSQQARRAMDRIVGYRISPFIWRTVTYGLSAGRVQSVALRLICEREEEIRAFNPVEYWSITGEFFVEDSDPFYAKLMKIGGNDFEIPTSDEVNRTLESIKAQQYKISKVDTKAVKRHPAQPFITSTLQQEAARRLGLSAKRTMSLAQKLYEGIDLGDEGTMGLITYMRTDSVRVSAEAVAAAREYIYNNYGKEYLPEKPRVSKVDKKSQDAHEAIRPTSMKFDPKSVKKFLDKDLHRVYELIWNRFIASQMASAEFNQITLEVEGGEYLFRATDQISTFRGFLQVWDDVQEANGDKADEDPVSKLPSDLQVGDPSTLQQLLPRQHFTKPPPRYTESSLVKELESSGIGRPSTYAMIVSTVVDRKYVEQTDRRLFATDLGMQVNKLLVQYFPNIFNVQFTAQLEEELDTIASGDQKYEKVMKDFYIPFQTALDNVKKLEGKIKQSLTETTEEACEKCGKPLVIKWGRNGKFMACSGYPTCRTTKPMPEEQKKLPQIVGVKCELCGSDMVVKTGKFGSFLGCSGYPKCKNTKPFTTGLKCPKCAKNELVERRSIKRRKVFYGCAGYPECNFATWDTPVAGVCPSCGFDVLLRSVKKKGTTLKCAKCEEVTIEETVPVAQSA
jgi:DNA topoisomerase-1